MARKQITGLTQKGETWHINKVYKGRRICESTGLSKRSEAEAYLIKRLEDIRQENVYGVRFIRTWEQAAAKYLEENMDMPSIGLTATYLEQMHPFIGHLPVTHIDNESLQPFIEWMQEGGVMPDGKTKKKPSSARTINIALQRVVRILNLCARSWRDANKKPWIDTVPMIQMMDENKTARKAYPLSWDEQRLLFAELPDHLKPMALFKVNTGCREQEVCKLEWNWEIKVPELNTSVFLIPANFGGRSKNSGVKNGDDRVVILNDVAKSIIEAQRNKHKKWVFPVNGVAMHRMNDTAWRGARIRAAKKWLAEFGEAPHPAFSSVRVHDLKTTFGRRLRAAGVSFEDRQALLGHKSGSVTTDYSTPEIASLVREANKVSATDSRTPVLTMLRRKAA